MTDRLGTPVTRRRSTVRLKFIVLEELTRLRATSLDEKAVRVHSRFMGENTDLRGRVRRGIVMRFKTALEAKAAAEERMKRSSDTYGYSYTVLKQVEFKEVGV
jgi:hypothetical protein